MKALQIIAGLIGLSIVAGFFFWILCLNHTSVNEIGVVYNTGTGNVYTQEKPGWYYTNILTRVAYISTVPIKVTIPSEAKVIVSKMVKFNVKGINTYIQLQGFGYDMNSSLENVLLGYAFSGNKYPFLDIVQESTNETYGYDRKIVK
jgi:hypothetical protein